MAINSMPILNANTVPDDSNEVFQLPFNIIATTSIFKHLCFYFGRENAAQPTVAAAVRGLFRVPQNFSGSPTIQIFWTSSVITGNVSWKFQYRTSSGDNTETLNSGTWQEGPLEVIDAAPSTAYNLLNCSISLTTGNFAAGDIVQFELYRDGADIDDTLAATAILVMATFNYSD